jgi:hypothetical protein
VPAGARPPTALAHRHSVATAGGGGGVGHGGLGRGLTRAREAVERRCDGCEGGGGGALGVGSLDARREGKDGRGGVVRGGGAGTPFYRVRGGAGQPNREGNQAADGGAPLWAIQFGGEGKRRG